MAQGVYHPLVPVPYTDRVVRQSLLMIYVEFDDSNFNREGCVNNPQFSDNLRNCLTFSTVIAVQSDGHELERCCAILGRELPPNLVYTFLGVNAQEIARNWYA